VKRQRTFNGFVLFDRHCLENGVRRKLRGREIEQAFRLWARHSDVRLGRVKA
jgi:hypothetical protein